MRCCLGERVGHRAHGCICRALLRHIKRRRPNLFAYCFTKSRQDGEDRGPLSFVRLTTIPRGFDIERASPSIFALPGTRYTKDVDVTRFFETVLGEARALPGVESAAVSSYLPLQGDSWEDTSNRERPAARIATSDGQSTLHQPRLFPASPYAAACGQGFRGFGPQSSGRHHLRRPRPQAVPEYMDPLGRKLIDIWSVSRGGRRLEPMAWSHMLSRAAAPRSAFASQAGRRSVLGLVLRQGMTPVGRWTRRGRPWPPSPLEVTYRPCCSKSARTIQACSRSRQQCSPLSQYWRVGSRPDVSPALTHSPPFDTSSCRHTPTPFATTKAEPATAS
jgi:hypothetical protein